MKDFNLSFIKVYSVPILVLLTIIFLVPLVLFPQLESIRDKSVEAKDANEKLKSLEAKILKLSQIDESDESIKLIEMEKVVPSGKEPAQIVIGVRSLASKAKLSIEELILNPGKVATKSATTSAQLEVAPQSPIPPAQNQESKDELKISLSVRGTLSELANFLEEIEGAKRLLGISLVELKFDEEDKSYIFDITVFAPFKSIKSENSPVLQPLPGFTADQKQTYDQVTNFSNFTNVTIQEGPTGVPDPFR